MSPDYLTANDPTLTTPLTEDQRANLYAELASGAETGWDYSSRWAKDPLAGSAANQNPTLRSLNVRSIVPVCLNSILCAYRSHCPLCIPADSFTDKAHMLVADLYDSQSTNTSSATAHRATAASLQSGILDLLWDSSKLAFYDFNLTSNARNSIFSAATFYPLWNGIVPTELTASSENAFGFFSSVNMVMNRYNGTLPVTYIETNLQWYGLTPSHFPLRLIFCAM